MKKTITEIEKRETFVVNLPRAAIAVRPSCAICGTDHYAIHHWQHDHFGQ